MTEHADQLREAFEIHENDTPDPVAVYARVQELSGKYKRRRRGFQVAGGAALAGLAVAGIVTVPNLLPGNARNTSSVSFPAGAVPTSAAPSAIPSLSEADLEKGWAAYFAAGYDYDDAVKLSELWHVKAPIGNVKAEAGLRLLAGETLPFPATPNAPEPTRPAGPAADKQLDAFFGAGYTWDEAVRLAKIWHLSDPSDAKVMAGKKLLAGETLPVQPKPANVKAAKEEKQVAAFFNKGYSVEDAVKLAKIWHLKDAWSAKIEGGKRILAGQSLPIKP
ncbi:hypothetical protein GCM10010172_61540 [Paractinoplanes ferrugineus]|uniref:Uncharacterized protein n=1 Tax=Paractinoplanes ferrugineus TaxID=113564 RepID=A0A919J7M9_9ACTN|nr:hypothetical protein [Actinoplanes ferrugineus]GIE14518.1 hypothetical protein Afe05nite_63580 [Actinoplanes ferrugineus]